MKHGGAPRLLGMTTSAFDPASRFRFVQFIPHFEHAGWQVAFRPNRPDRQWSSSLPGRIPRGVHHRIGRGLMKWNRWRDVAGAGQFDSVFVNRDLAGRGTFFQQQLFRRNPRVVFDFDDAIFIGDNEPAVRWMCERAAWVTPGNRYLAEFVGRYTDRCTIVPTVIDTEEYRAVRAPGAAAPRVGWSGSDQSIQVTLFPFLPLLAEIQRSLDFELVVITNTRPKIETAGLRWSFLPWSADSEVSGLQSLDVGLMPLADDAFQKGKCGLKALQYMAVGRPVIASPVGVNAEIVEHERTGFHATADGEWAGALRALVASPEKRNTMGDAGRRRCEESYSVRRWFPVLDEILGRVGRS
jgi:glycosyltransferase involved in cell wall biosynthesis